jgi:hypothetical protein
VLGRNQDLFHFLNTYNAITIPANYPLGLFQIANGKVLLDTAVYAEGVKLEDFLANNTAALLVGAGISRAAGIPLMDEVSRECERRTGFGVSAGEHVLPNVAQVMFEYLSENTRSASPTLSHFLIWSMVRVNPFGETGILQLMRERHKVAFEGEEATRLP